MEYISAKEASEKWGINIRTVQRLCKEGQVPGAKKYGTGWLLPSTLPRPIDRRRTGSRTRYLGCGTVASSVPMPKDDPDSVLGTFRTECVRRQYEGEIAYLRGDFERALRCFSDSKITDSTYLCAALVTMAAAVSTGNSDIYQQTERAMKRLYSTADELTRNIADMCSSMLMLAMDAPELIPEWIQNGDPNGRLPPESHHMMVYLFARCLMLKRRCDEVVASCKTAHMLSIRENSFTIIDIYMGLVCAVAFHNLGAAEWRDRALMLVGEAALPNGFITPFSEFFRMIGSAMEALYSDPWPEQLERIKAQHERTWKHWIDFHNHFTRDNITTILSQKEYLIARIIAHGGTYKDAAAESGLSLGTVKNTVSELYSKLCISKKSELAKYIL